MKYWSEFQDNKIVKNVSYRKKHNGKMYNFIDSTIYSFDIETSSYLTLGDKIIPGCKYSELSEKDQEKSNPHGTMYIWMFGINDQVYYGRTWDEFREFLKRLESKRDSLKIVHVHNLSFEFQFLKGEFDFTEVQARKSYKVMTALMKDFNILFKCTYFMTNCSLAQIPKVFGLNTKKMVGDLDYDLIRHSETPLSEKELGYCEHDCLVLYEYLKKECEEYGDVGNIPTTSTGKVRRELKRKVSKDYAYKNKTRKAVNTDGHIYNLLCDCFMGGFVHANWLYADEVLEDVDSWDFTSSYP